MNKRVRRSFARGAKRTTALALALTLALSGALAQLPTMTVKAAAENQLASVINAEANGNVVTLNFRNGLNEEVQGKITFLEDGIFRYNVDPAGEFSEYAVPRNQAHKARIQQYPDNSANYKKPAATVTVDNGVFTITNGTTTIVFDAEAKMTVKAGDKVVMQEKEALSLAGTGTVQTLVQNDSENFYGGGTQNGRFVHTGEEINIANESGWTDGGVASPNPFYYTTAGYGVLRNTFADGKYNFGKAAAGTVTATHRENEFDAYYFVSDGANGREVVQDLLNEYFKVTGNPVLLPEYAFYEGHLNAYNRDKWTDVGTSRGWKIMGNAPFAEFDNDAYGERTWESGGQGYKPQAGDQLESLNGTGATLQTQNIPADVTTPYKFSARKVLDDYFKYDMPIGYFLPNDGYGAGYGQNGLGVTGGVNADGTSSAERLAVVAANVQNLKEFTDYANEKGVETGLWTQSYLVPDSNPKTEWQLLRDFRSEVRDGGITTLKTDVAWVGHGYSMQLDGVKTSYDIATTEGDVRPNIISLDGWAGSQRYCGIWTGDQTGGNWEYIRFHVPTYIGQSLSGNPNIGSDMDGIFGGNHIVSTRDYQWKSFTPLMLNMDGWGSYAKMPYTFGDPYTGINRMYMKLKAQMLPYIYTTAASAANIDTGNDDAGLPFIRAMFLEYPDDAHAYSKAMQYQYLMGSDVLVAPIYQDTAVDEVGNDIRNSIYLPGTEDVWVDYFTGEQYRGGQTLNNFDAPIWKLPLFVKNGAIIPMWEENNTPAEIDRANRIVEFWPAGSTSYTAFEDDGKFVENEIDNTDAAYGDITNASYGEHVSTVYTSEVSGETATLTAQPSTGSYTGYNQNKNTTFVVNVSEAPESIVAKNGDTTLNATAAADKAAFDAAAPAAGEAVYFYDANPAINTYASAEETEIAALVENVQVAPKLYVKFAQADTKAAAQTLVINGFANDGNLSAEVENPALDAPVLTEDEALKSPTSINLKWDKVDGATSYELMIDGVLSAVKDVDTFTHADLDYHSTHTYQIRSRNADGYSEWGEVKEFTSAEDPWRNTPTPASIHYAGEIYGGHKAELAFDKIFQSGDGGFHSNGPTPASEAPLTVDYGKGYKFDKIEYYPRDDAGNGTVTQMKLETSLDGIHWTEIGTFDWARDKNMKTMEVDTPARYLRMTALQSVGGFFAASEIKVYKEDGTNAFAVGSANYAEEITDATFTNMENYLGFSAKDDMFEAQIKNYGCDINMNNVYDVYDYAFPLFQYEGGTTKTGSVSGNAMLLASHETVKAGETFTIDVYADNIENLNAFGQVINYDPTKVEFVAQGAGKVEQSPYISQMTNLTANKVYEDNTAYVNLAFGNKGDKALYSGSGVLATITMRAKEDITLTNDIIDLSTVTLIGPDYSVIESQVENNPELPDLPPTEVTKQFVQADFDITMTNEFLPTDDGTNVTQLIQQNKYDGLFNGNNTEGDRSFELKWDMGDGTLAECVKLPIMMHMALKTPQPVDKIVIYPGAKAANGYPTKLSAQLIYEDDTTSEVKEVSDENYVFEFESDKNVKQIEIGLLQEKDAAQTHLTLTEIEVTNTTLNVAVPVEGIVPDENNETELYVGDLADINGAVTPDNATNPYFTVTSSNEAAVRILTLADANGLPVYKARAMAPGVSTITLTAAGDETKTATYEITVLEGVDISGLQAAIQDAGKHAESVYTADTYAALKTAVDAATELLAGGEYTKNEVASAEMAIRNAIEALKFRPVNPDNLINTSAETDITVTKATSEVLISAGEDGEKENVLDYDNGTYWHSNYMNNREMPQSLWFDLGETYNLTDVTFLPRQNNSNADIFEAEILVSSDGETYSSVGTFTFANNGTVLDNRTEFQQAAFEATGRYVQFKVLHAGGHDEFAAMSEIRFYGTTDAEPVYKDALQQLVDGYEAEDLKEAAYTADSWKAYQDALAAAKAVLADPNATNEDVDAAGKALVAAYKALTKAEAPGEEADKKELENLYNQYNGAGLKQGDYTADSWAKYLAAMTNAQSVLANENATQDAVDAAVAALKAAHDGLKAAENNGTDEDGNGGGDDNSGSNNNGGSSNGGSNTSQAGGAKTGDSTQVGLWVLLLAVAAGGAAYVVMKKKRESK